MYIGMHTVHTARAAKLIGTHGCTTSDGPYYTKTHAAQGQGKEGPGDLEETGRNTAAFLGPAWLGRCWSSRPGSPEGIYDGTPPRQPTLATLGVRCGPPLSTSSPPSLPRHHV
ncbi:hypothetical protein MRX96_052015 [Rhipicephalus microplus]